MGTVPTGTMESKLRSYYIQWLRGLDLSADVGPQIDAFRKRSLAIISEYGGQAASLGAILDFPAPKELDLAPQAGIIYDQMKTAAIRASISIGLNATDAARAMVRAGMQGGFNKLNRLARTETVRAYWKNSWDSIDGLGLVMVWSAEKGPRTCPWCLARDGMVVEERTVQDHPNGRCTLVPKLPSKVDFKGIATPAGTIDTSRNFQVPFEAPAPAVESVALTQKTATATLSAQPAQAMSKTEATTWAKANMLDVKTMPADVQESIVRYTGGGYKGTNQTLRTGTWPGDAVSAQARRDMISGLDVAMQASTVPEQVVVTRLVHAESFKGGDPSKLVGKTISDKGYLSTALGGKVGGPGFTTQNVEMKITVPPGTHGIWTKPLSQYKGEAELLLDRNTKLNITEAVFNERRATWQVTATVVP